MIGAHAVNGTGTRRGVLMMTMALLTVLLLGPSGASGAKTFSECMNETWPDYNECLVEANTWISRFACDVSWELEAAECFAQEVGEVRKAVDGKTNEPD